MVTDMIYSYRAVDNRHDYSKIDPALLKRGTYKICNAINHKFSIGSTHSTFIKRFKTHVDRLNKGKHTNPHLQASFNKYGKDTFCFCIIDIVKRKDAIKAKEQALLDRFQKTDTCYNISRDASAPMLGIKHTKESLEKMSKASLYRAKEIGEITRRHRTGAKHTKATIAKFRIAARSRDDSKRIAALKTESFRRKQYLLHKWVKRSKEWRSKMLIIFRSPAYRRKMSEVKKGIRPSEETKVKIALARGAKEHIFMKDGIEFVVTNVREFARENNIDRDAIRRILKGHTSEEHCGWKYIRTVGQA